VSFSGVQSLLDVARSNVANWQTPWTAAEISIRRNRIVEDGFEHLSGRPGESMRGRMRIHFINEFGEHEAGVDGGGLFKDFMEGIIKVAFDVQYGLFKVGLESHVLRIHLMDTIYRFLFRNIYKSNGIFIGNQLAIDDNSYNLESIQWFGQAV
jgi:hypothetical protein